MKSVIAITAALLISASLVASATDSTLTDGMPGIEVGGWYPAYFSNLTVASPPA